MASTEIRATNSLQGEMDGVPYNIFCMKEPKYMMKLMSTYGGLIEQDTATMNKRVKLNQAGEAVNCSFKYTETFQNHFLYRYAVDYHNNLRHATPAIEEAWVDCQNVFLCDCSVKSEFVFNIHMFSWKKKIKYTLLEYKIKLAFALMQNE